MDGGGEGGGLQGRGAAADHEGQCGAGAGADVTADHIVVTGGSTGIGFATAKLLAERGARVSLIARDADKLDAALAVIGCNAQAFPADVGDKVSLIAALEAAASAQGPIHGLFANAGTGGTFAPVQTYADDDF